MGHDGPVGNLSSPRRAGRRLWRGFAGAKMAWSMTSTPFG